MSWPKGRPCPEAVKQKISATLKGVPKPAGHGAKVSAARKGKKLPPETRAKLQSVQRNRSPEWRAKLREVRRGKAPPWARDPETRKAVGRRISNTLRGRRKSETHKERLREARRRQKFPRSQTGPEMLFAALCKDYRLPFKYVGNGALWIEGVNPDFVDINGKKVAVDIFGDYWHTPLFRKKALPARYTEEGRRRVLARYGWRLVVIWESELHLPDIKDRILHKLGRKYGRR